MQNKYIICDVCEAWGGKDMYIYLRSRDILAASFPHTSRTRSAKGFRGKYDISSLCISVCPAQHNNT